MISITISVIYKSVQFIYKYKHSDAKGVHHMNKELCTVDDLCKELGIGKNSGYKLLKCGVIKSTKIGRRIIFHRSELEKYILNLKTV